MREAVLPSFALAGSLLLAACTATGPAPVVDRGGPPPARVVAPAPLRPGAVHRVVRGDTLYSIAFRHGLDYRDLARWNGIAAPYTIYVGQEVHLAPPVARSPAQVAARPAQQAPAPRGGAVAPARAPAVAAQPAAGREAGRVAPASATSGAPASAAMPTPAAAPPATAAAPAPAAAVPPAAVAAAATGGIQWRWPAGGQVVGGFVAGDHLRQGIDIAGRAGDPVRVAAAGEVVYSGNGLRGYGELVIIKHSPDFLSAYGHNRKRLVNEGERVAAGQQIAEMGTGIGGRDALHFEIRRNGKPENPLQYLPRR